ncbi:unnamed protein product [Phaeothamnion confervicola]
MATGSGGVASGSPLHLTALASPMLYQLYVRWLGQMPPGAKASLLRFEYLHNIGLALLSAAMLVGILLSISKSGKGSTYYALVCRRFEEDALFELTAHAFFWSKIWEWGDTALLVAKGKSITWLHYTHHASTCFLTGLNMTPVYNAMWSVVCATNSFVHAWMYLYYAHPRLLRWSRRLLTLAQMAQHAFVLATGVYVVWRRYGGADTGGNAGNGGGGLEDCYNDSTPILVGLALYLMYLLFFAAFYKRRYASSSGKAGKEANGGTAAPVEAAAPAAKKGKQKKEV